jgi:hypothetical protein
MYINIFIQLQSDQANLSTAVQVWLSVYNNKELVEYKNAIKKRFEFAMEPFHFICYLTNPTVHMMTDDGRS